jgi:hypothetical protein
MKQPNSHNGFQINGYLSVPEMTVYINLVLKDNYQSSQLDNLLFEIKYFIPVLSGTFNPEPELCFLIP